MCVTSSQGRQTLKSNADSYDKECLHSAHKHKTDVQLRSCRLYRVEISSYVSENVDYHSTAQA